MQAPNTEPPVPPAQRTEWLVALGRAGEALRDAAGRPSAALTQGEQFALGRAALEEEDFRAARAHLVAAAEGFDPDIARRAAAHLAYLDYYDGNFELGRDRARRAGDGARGIVAAEADLYQSVNSIALNQSADALALALRAQNRAQRVEVPWLRIDLRFRTYRQLVHVLVARGSYTTAWSEAERARTIARRLGEARFRGLASYLCGLVMTARGDPSGITYFHEADRHWGGQHHAFGRWLKYVWAMALRDQGQQQPANDLRKSSGIALPWEEPLFELAAGNDAPIVETDGPIDERPFRLAAAGLVHAVRNEFDAAELCLRPASQEFERCELEHYRRGAVMALIATYLGCGRTSEAAAAIASEQPALLKFRIFRWPWWYPKLAQRIADFCVSSGLEPRYWAAFRRPESTTPSTDVLRALDLSDREIEIVLTWSANPDWSRSTLAERLRISEGTARNLLNRARRKMSCDPGRGAAAFQRRLDRLITQAASVAETRRSS